MKSGKAFLVFIFFAIFIIITPANVFSASLYLSPLSKEVYVGDSFSVIIYVNSSEQSINAISAQLSWSDDLIRLTSFSKVGSIINFWVKEPNRFNNQLDFEGAIFNPGYVGSNGKILTLNFTALKEGRAEINFSSGMILANDGEGTNIIKGLNSASIIIKERKISFIEDSEAVDKPVVSKIAVPNIFSPSHPDPQKWYANPNPMFEWSMPSDIVEVRIGYDINPNFVPKDKYSPPINKKQLKNLSDGSYYFGVQLVGRGTVSEISRFKFNIDNRPPEIKELYFVNLDQDSASIRIKASDKLSGISEINIYLDDKLLKKVENREEYEDIITGLTPESHLLRIEIIDRAGNKIERLEKIIGIKPVEIVMEKDYTLYMLLLLFILIVIILFILIKRKLEKVHQEIESQKLDEIKEDFHKHILDFLSKTRKNLSLLDDDPGLNQQEKEIYRKIREILAQTEFRLKNFLDSFSNKKME
ncbi:MAG: cohesin domain-containing protein [Patescibacteria group bacterium]|nr:cohesin domain-containing protein [Patescibacteria group bacterium]